jgi:hypothetical protein
MTSAEKNFEQLDLRGWSFSKVESDNTRLPGGNVSCTMDLSTLVRLLTATSGEEQRHEWARRLVLEASERLPNAGLKNLWTSIGRESWREAQSRRQRERERVALPAASVVASAPPPIPGAAAEREELAAELNHMIAALRRAILHQKRAGDRDDDKAPLAPEDPVSTESFVPDVLRAGKAGSHTSTAASADDGGAGGVGDSGAHSGVDTAILYCEPTWRRAAVAGGASSAGRLQATLRFEPPGIAYGDRVVVAGPDGTPMPLLAPPGVQHLQRVLVSLPDPKGAAAGGKNSLAGAALRIDIIPLGADALPGSLVVVDGVSVALPSYAAPFTSLVLAMPSALDGIPSSGLLPTRRHPQTPSRQNPAKAVEADGRGTLFPAGHGPRGRMPQHSPPPSPMHTQAQTYAAVGYASGGAGQRASVSADESAGEDEDIVFEEEPVTADDHGDPDEEFVASGEFKVGQDTPRG